MLPAELYEVVQLLAAALIQVPACMPTPPSDLRAFSTSSGSAGSDQGKWR